MNCLGVELPWMINRNSDPIDTAVPASGYHPAYDRGGTIPAQNTWNLLPADGAVIAGDLAALVIQFGHDCLSPLP